MQLVIDANVVILALATDGAVRTAIRTSTDDVCTPWYIQTEIDNHRTAIRKKSGLSTQTFDALIQELVDYVEIIPQEAMRSHLHDAARGMQLYDPDDMLYVAAALAVDGTVVSNDQAFEKQRTFPHMWTNEFVERALGLGDDQHRYLAPHGGRRGMGEVLVRQFGYATAARYLDNSEQMVRERYSHIEAGEQADMATEALAASDQRVRTNRNDNGEVADREEWEIISKYLFASAPPSDR
jgi:predicted nucleic acid-binding protein